MSGSGAWSQRSASSATKDPVHSLGVLRVLAVRSGREAALWRAAASGQVAALEQLGDRTAQRRQRRLAQALELDTTHAARIVAYQRGHTHGFRLGSGDAQLQRRVELV